MKSVSLIPFIVGLIGYDQCVQDSPDLWKYGPEYNFGFQVFGSVYAEQNREAQSNVSGIVKCRPFASKSDGVHNALRCHIHSAEIENYEKDKSSSPPKIVRLDPAGPFEITGWTFDVIFGKTQVEAIQVHDDIKNFRLNIYRTLVSQFSFGFNRFPETKEMFTSRGYESSTIGQCDTKFEILQHMKSVYGRTWQSKCKTMRLEVAGSDYSSLMLEKTRNLDNCTRLTPYMFGEDFPPSNPLFTTTMNTSVSGIMVTPHSFESHTIDTGFIIVNKPGDKDFPKKMPTYLEIGLHLMSIKPASAEFKVLKTYGVTRIFANEEIVTVNNEARVG